MNSAGKIFINPARIIRSGENSFTLLIRDLESSEEMNGENCVSSIRREGTEYDSATSKICASLLSEKTAFISALPN